MPEEDEPMEAELRLDDVTAAKVARKEMRELTAELERRLGDRAEDDPLVGLMRRIDQEIEIYELTEEEAQELIAVPVEGGMPDMYRGLAEALYAIEVVARERCTDVLRAEPDSGRMLLMSYHVHRLMVALASARVAALSLRESCEGAEPLGRDELRGRRPRDAAPR